MTLKTITLGELRDELTGLLEEPDETRLYFGNGNLTFGGIKQRGAVDGPALLQFVFNEVYSVTPDEPEEEPSPPSPADPDSLAGLH